MTNTDRKIFAFAIALTLIVSSLFYLIVYPPRQFTPVKLNEVTCYLETSQAHVLFCPVNIAPPPAPFLEKNPPKAANTH